jgi:LCP family protein required for cell wall assembly
MTARRQGALAGVLSLLLPGAGQLYLGRRVRAAVLFGLTALLVLGVVLLATSWTPAIDRRLVAVVVGLDAALLALRLAAVVDAARTARATVLVALAVLAAAPHVGLAYVTIRSYDVLEGVFDGPGSCGQGCDRERPLLVQEPALPAWVAPDTWQLALVEQLGPDEIAALTAEPEVLRTADAAPAEAPWTTILLLGTDEGPGNWGARTDTIILAAVEHGTGRAAAFGIPRNLTQIPRGDGRPPFREPINALYNRSGEGPEGARAVKEAVSALLGIRVDYYALVDLLGFADLVDALGGVEIRVRERLQDEVTRPAWGEPKPTIDVRPGEVRRFYGREALAYVRSRKDSNDYTRMARQRCFLSAVAAQLDPVRVLRHFGSLARTIETSLESDIPLDRLPSLVRLAAAVDPAQTLTVTFGPQYFFARRVTDRYPTPHVGKIRRQVRRAILTPELLSGRGGAATAASC